MFTAGGYMLKKVRIREKEIPVPIPVRNLQEAIVWITSTFLEEGSVLTKVTLDGVDLAFGDEKIEKGVFLSEDSVLRIQIDNPRQLSIKTLDVIRDISVGMNDKLKLLAVKGWQSPSNKDFLYDVRLILDDLNLALHMIEHVNGLVDYTHVDAAPVNGTYRLLIRVREKLKHAYLKADGKECATLLLNRLEPLLKELSNESENLQIRIFSTAVEDPDSIVMGF
jgi:hypothetical protein